MIGKTITIKENSSFNDCQGVVVGEEGSCYIVDLDKSFHYLLGHPIVWDDKELPYGQIRVVKEDVREEDLRLDVRVKNLFGEVWDVYSLKNPIDLNDICSHENCNNKVSKRILVNIWGVVYEYDCCEIHAEEYHGKRLDIFPGKK